MCTFPELLLDEGGPCRFSLMKGGRVDSRAHPSTLQGTAPAGVASCPLPQLSSTPVHLLAPKRWCLRRARPNIAPSRHPRARPAASQEPRRFCNDLHQQGHATTRERGARAISSATLPASIATQQDCQTRLLSLPPGLHPDVTPTGPLVSRSMCHVRSRSSQRSPLRTGHLRARSGCFAAPAPTGARAKEWPPRRKRCTALVPRAQSSG